MLGVLVEGMKKVGEKAADWIEKTFGSPDIDEEIEKLFMENEEQEEELKNVIMETEENKKDELVRDVEKYEDKDDLMWYFLVFNNYSWGSFWWFCFSDDD
jgi:DNA repair exonuclease SbcCD ATPase subunit